MSFEHQQGQPQSDQQGLYDFLAQFITPRKLELFDSRLERRTRFLTVVLESVDKGHNASASLRSCECFGIQDLHIIRRSKDFKLRNDVISGAGRWLTVRGYRGENESGFGDETARYYEKLRAHGYRIVATAPAETSVCLSDFRPNEPTALVFGSELLGLSASAIENADEQIHIPMSGFTESLNLSVAVAITLHQLRSKLDSSAVNISLAPESKQKIRNRWIKQALGHKFDSYVRRYHTG